MCGSVLMQVFKQIWYSGMFTTKSKTIAAIKKLLIIVVIVVILGCILGGVFMTFVDKSKHMEYQDTFLAAILIISHVYSLIVFVMLIANGLIKLPIFFWKYYDNKYQLLSALVKAEQVRKSYRVALIDYHDLISIIRKLEDKFSNQENEQFWNVLMQDLPETDLEG